MFHSSGLVCRLLILHFDSNNMVSLKIDPCLHDQNYAGVNLDQMDPWHKFTVDYNQTVISETMGIFALIVLLRQEYSAPDRFHFHLTDKLLGCDNLTMINRDLHSLSQRRARL